MGIAQVYICSRCLRIWDTSSQAISCCGAVARPASICTENVLDEQRRTIEQAYSLVTQWLASPEPPNTGELVALATILEGKPQPEDGREDV